MIISSSRVVLTALLVACGIIVGLVVQVRGLRDELRSTEEQSMSMLEGTLMPISAAASLSGDSVLLGQIPSAGQVYFVFNTRCPFCRRNIETWNTLRRRLDSIAIPVLGISLDSAAATSAYITENQVEFETVVFSDERMKHAYRFGTLPQTLVVDSTGRLLLSRVGVLNEGSALDSVFATAQQLVVAHEQPRPPERRHESESAGRVIPDPDRESP